MSQIIYPTPQPYCYHITCIPTRQSYIGVRYANKVSAEQDLLVFYSTSSKSVNLLIEEHGKDAFRIDWIRTYNTKEEARAEEMILLKEHDVLNNDLYLNQAMWPSTDNRGKVPWNKGKTGIYSAEAIQQMSESAKLERASAPPRITTAETRKKIGKAHKGKVVTAEMRKTMSEAQKKYWASVTDRKLKVPRTAEHQRKLNEAYKNRVPWNKGKKTGSLTEEHRRTIGEGCKGKIRSPRTAEHTKNHSESLKRYYASRKAAE